MEQFAFQQPPKNKQDAYHHTGGRQIKLQHPHLLFNGSVSGDDCMHFYLEPFKCYNASKLMILQYDAPANGEAQGGVKGKGRIGEGRGKGSGPLQRAFTTQRHDSSLS